MVGPLFLTEMLLGGRRSRDHIVRWVYGGWLIVQVLFFALEDLSQFLFTPQQFDYTSYVCRHFVEFFVPQHFILLALVTPAFIAGAVTDEKTKGTLQYLLTTDLAPIHILTGKLLARAAQVFTLSLTGLPLFALIGVLGGVEPPLLLGLLIVTMFVALGVSSATFLAGVWARQTREAVLGLYAVGIAAVLLAAWIGGPLRYFNPLYLLEPAMFSAGLPALRDLSQRLLPGLAAWGGLTLLCLGVASWRLRPAYIRQLQATGRPARRRWWRWDRPAIGMLPVLWKERHIDGLAPVPSLRSVPRWLGLVVVVVAAIAASGWGLYSSRKIGVTHDAFLDLATHGQVLELAEVIDKDEAADWFWVQASVAINVFALLVAVRCSGSVTGERERQTWDALLLTPLSLEQLIRGKLWGITLVGYVYLLAYAVPALLLSLFGGWMAVFWTGIGLAATLLAMYYLGAVGLWASVRSRGSWQSLLTTVFVAYLVGLVISACPGTLLATILGAIIVLVVQLVGAYFGIDVGGLRGAFTSYFGGFRIGLVIATAIFLWIAARLFLRWAQQWVGYRERTRHWENEPRSSRQFSRRRGSRRR